MPHVIVKLWPGKTEAQKTCLAEEITESVMRVLGYGAEAVSVGLDEVAPEDWTAEVYGPDIQHGRATLYKKPGYGPLA